MKIINVLIADTSEIYRTGLVSVLHKWPGFNVVGIFANGEDAIEKTKELKPDIVLLDENIYNPDCIEVAKRINQDMPQTRLIVFTDNKGKAKDPFYIFGTQAASYIDRQIDSGNLASIINRVMEGDFFVSPLQGKKLFEELNRIKKAKQNELSYSLTKREKEVLFHIGDGLTNREIANKLFITENTVKAHSNRIMQKMQLQNRHQIMLAVSKGLLSDII